MDTQKRNKYEIFGMNLVDKYAFSILIILGYPNTLYYIRFPLSLDSNPTGNSSDQ